MKSAFAEAIGAFFANGGEIKQCPEGNGLAPQPWVPRKMLGIVPKQQKRKRKNCEIVFTALAASATPLTADQICQTTKLSEAMVNGALAQLTGLGRVAMRGGGRQGVLRLFSLTAANTDTGNSTGGPASASAAEARVAGSSTSAARPGSEAA